MVTAIYFNREFDTGKVKINYPITDRPFAFELAFEGTVAQCVEDLFELRFGSRDAVTVLVHLRA